MYLKTGRSLKTEGIRSFCDININININMKGDKQNEKRTAF